jgi:phosphoribosylanthranilate isomerase
MTRVKICGITSVTDALGACEAGADMLGLNFYPQSPRAISIQRAADLLEEIRAQLPAGLQVFGVFVNADPAEIKSVAKNLKLDAVQLHGDEDRAMVSQIANSATVFKALRVGAHFSAATLENYPEASGFLFDAADGPPCQYGGTGRLSDWGVAQQAARSYKVILAGGLSAGNVAAAILQVRPYGVDVASGVESAPGRKDFEQVREFIREARRADQELGAPVAEAERLRVQ